MNSIAEPSETAVAALSDALRKTSIAALFDADPGRAERFTFEAEGFALDLSKHKLDAAS